MSSNHGPKQLHGRKTPPGAEVVILKKMPLLFAGSALAIGSLSPAARLFSDHRSLAEGAKQIASVDIFVIATIATLWTGLLTVTIGCVLVHIMKGPAYAADAYPLQEPASPRESQEQKAG